MAINMRARALSVLSKVAQADWPDRLNLRQSVEKLIFSGSRASFRFAASRASAKSHSPRRADELFDLSLSEEQQMLVEMLGHFAREQLRPAAHDADAAQQVPQHLLDQITELGLAQYGVSEAQGGLAGERTILTTALIAEALAYGDFSLAASLLQPLSAANCIRRWASAEQQAQWLVDFMGEQPPIYSLAFAEAGVLQDPQQLRTQAKTHGKHYLISGAKALVLGGAQAQYFLLSAQTAQGPALFRVPAQSKGICCESAPAMGLRACGLTRVDFDKVKVPKNARLSGAELNYQQVLDYGALAFCALAVGTAQAALDYVAGYCNERQAFGEPISHRQGVAFMVADMAVELESMRMLLWRACSRAEQGLSFAREAYLARLLCAEMAMKIGSDAVQLLGGHGFTKEHPVERWYRDLRSVAVISGALHL